MRERERKTLKSMRWCVIAATAVASEDELKERKIKKRKRESRARVKHWSP